MFIKNDLGEVVNINKITAFTVCNDKLPYEIRVYTPATTYGIQFRYDTIEALNQALANLEKLLMPIEIRWIKFANWQIAASKVESVSSHGFNLRIRMDNAQTFDIIGHSHAEHEQWKSELSASLKNNWAMLSLATGEVVNPGSEET